MPPMLTHLSKVLLVLLDPHHAQLARITLDLERRP